MITSLKDAKAHHRVPRPCFVESHQTVVIGRPSDISYLVGFSRKFQLGSCHIVQLLPVKSSWTPSIMSAIILPEHALLFAASSIGWPKKLRAGAWRGTARGGSAQTSMLVDSIV